MKRGMWCLRDLVRIMELLQSEIRYGNSPLPEACLQAGKKVGKPYSLALERVFTCMEENKGLSFAFVWKREMKECLDKLPIGKKERELFLQFANYSGFSDGQMQMRALEEYSELLKQATKEMEKQIQSKGKVVMSMGVASGVLLSIILL